MVVAVDPVATADTTLKATEVAHKALERTGAWAIACSTASRAIGPRTAQLTLLQSLPRSHLLLLPCHSLSHREKRRPSGTFLSCAGPCLAKQ
jgi:hypothetical protein